MTESLKITDRSGAVRFGVRVIPRASRSEIEGMYGDALKVRLAAPPVEGAANEALVEVLSDVLGVPRSRVSIVAGGHSRSKLVEVEGMESGELRLRLEQDQTGTRRRRAGK